MLVGGGLAGGFALAGALVTLFGQSRLADAARRHELALAAQRMRREVVDRTLTRLRATYLEVIAVCLLQTPPQLGLQLHTMKAETLGEREDRLAALAERTTAVRARLTLEPDPTANNEVLMALVEIVTGSEVFAAHAQSNLDHPGLYTARELDGERRAISQAFLRIERLCRDHIRSLEQSA